MVDSLGTSPTTLKNLDKWLHTNCLLILTSLCIFVHLVLFLKWRSTKLELLCLFILMCQYEQKLRLFMFVYAGKMLKYMQHVLLVYEMGSTTFLSIHIQLNQEVLVGAVKLSSYLFLIRLINL